MSTHEICQSCQFPTQFTPSDEEIKIYTEFHNKINKLVDEADVYAISVWSNLSKQKRSDWADYIGKLREIQNYNDIHAKLPESPSRDE